MIDPIKRREIAARGAVLATSVAALALLAAGCGGGKTVPSVANLGTTTSNNSSGGSSSLRFPPDIGGLGASISTHVGASAAGIKYTDCMRSHRVPNFPDPDATGTLTITVSPSLNPSSPVFQKAEADCQHLLPPGKTLSQAQQQRMKQGALAFAECMRSHGVPHYPTRPSRTEESVRATALKAASIRTRRSFRRPRRPARAREDLHRLLGLG